MVVKLVMRMGCLVEREEEEGGVGMLWLLEMEEEMEGRMVEELVVEMEVGMVQHGRPIGRQGLFLWLPFRWLLEPKKKKKKYERERRKKGGYI